MTDKEAPSDDLANQEIGQENSAEKRKWTWKEFYERGFRHAGVTLWEWDSKTGVLLIDALALGHPFYYEFSSPTSWEKLVHKEDRERLLDALRRFEETPGSSLDCFFRLATKFTRWVHARDMHLVLDSEQKLSKVIGLFFDVTESELAKNQLFWGKQPPARDDGDGVRVLRMISERLRHEKDASRIAALRDQCYHQFMSVFSFSDIPSFRKDSDLFTIEVNPAMERLLGMSRDEIVKRRDLEIWGRGGSVRLKMLCTLVMLGETVLATTVRYVNSVRMEFLDQFYPEWGPNGLIEGICGLMAPMPVTAPIAAEDSPRRRDQVSASVRAIYAQVRLAAQHDCNVLLTGESGTGKDYLARQIHDLSKRADGPFENFNCAALQKELAGSELFGHEAGAFTGAKAMRRGIFELAAKGTVFLNEIGDMPLDLQPRLLTILETRSFRRVGGEKMVPLGARIIAATNADLNKEVEDRLFRKDLYHRLTVFSIRVPPLRERLGELPALVENLTKKLATDMGLETVPKLDTMATRKLRDYHWPGNIRELRNVLERAFIHSQGPLIGPEHVVFESEDTEKTWIQPSRIMRPERETVWSQGDETRKSADRPQKPSQNDIRALYQQFIVENRWTRARLADRLGVHSSTLKKWFKAAGLEAGKRGRPRKGP